MKKQLLTLASLVLVLSASAQIRYYNEVFTNAEIVKAASNQVYGINVDFLKNQQLYSPAYLAANNAQITTEHAEIRDSILSAVAAGTAPNIPTKYFTPFSSDPSTIIKLITPLPNNPGAGVFNPFHMGMMDIYMPNPGIDTESQRPVILYIHTGNFLPKGLNGGVSGTKDDSVVVEMCKQWARRGYVAVAANYRLGWNPVASAQSDRTRTLLNGVYRAIGDMKQVVRTLRTQASGLGIDPNNIIIYGQGSGGYVSLAYNFLDKYAETTLPKFDPDATGLTVIDTTYVGNVQGLGGLLNFYQYQSVPGTSADIQFCVNAGGALGDKSWIEGGEAPNITFHCPRDPFAPFSEGTVIVPTTGEIVVDADGPNVFMPFINNLGNNDSFKDLNTHEDPYTVRAREQYGKTLNTDIPIIIGGQSVTISTEAEGLYPFFTPQSISAPWEFWNEADFTAYHGYLSQLGFAPPTLAPAADILTNASNGNPNVKSQSLAYMDTINGYMHRRIMVSLQLGDWEAVNVPELAAIANDDISVYPNPAASIINFKSTNGDNQIARYRIFDISGRNISTMQNVNSSVLTLNVGSFAKGLYISEITLDNGKVISKKFSIE